ncbi:MAG: hypothetical protein WCW13_00680 [archaeon]
MPALQLKSPRAMSRRLNTIKFFQTHGAKIDKFGTAAGITAAVTGAATSRSIPLVLGAGTLLIGAAYRKKIAPNLSQYLSTNISKLIGNKEFSHQVSQTVSNPELKSLVRCAGQVQTAEEKGAFERFTRGKQILSDTKILRGIFAREIRENYRSKSKDLLNEARKLSLSFRSNSINYEKLTSVAKNIALKNQKNLGKENWMRDTMVGSFQSALGFGLLGAMDRARIVDRRTREEIIKTLTPKINEAVQTLGRVNSFWEKRVQEELVENIRALGQEAIPNLRHVLDAIDPTLVVEMSNHIYTAAGTESSMLVLNSVQK